MIDTTINFVGKNYQTKYKIEGNTFYVNMVKTVESSDRSGNIDRTERTESKFQIPMEDLPTFVLALQKILY